MFCSKCGTENADDARFCRNCGTPLAVMEKIESSSPQPDGEKGHAEESVSAESITQENVVDGTTNAESTGEVTQTTDVQSVDTGTGEVTAVQTEKKSRNNKTIIGIACVAVIIIAAIAIWMYNRTTINLNKYIVVDAEGYNGYGKAHVYVDWDAIDNKYGNSVKFTTAARSQYGTSTLFMTPSDVLSDYIVAVADAADADKNGFSNGDKVAYTWYVNDDYAKYLNCRIKYRDDEFTVSGLTDIGTFDAFADLEIEFSGISPNGTVNLNYLGNRLSYNAFSIDKYSNLSNGDVITVSIADYVIEQCADAYGEVPESLEKEYTVEGLYSYVTSIDQIDEAALSKMKAQAEDVYNAYVANDWGDTAELYGFSYLGEYLLTKKSSDIYGVSNRIILAYNIKAHNFYKSYDSINETYWYIAYENLLVSPDGDVEVNVLNYYTPRARYTFDSGVSYGWYGTYEWYYYGYNSLESLYSDAVLTNVDSYNHEDNIADSPKESNIEQSNNSNAEGDYVLKNSSIELISRSDLEGLTAEQCKIARNEIYARHGRKFDDAELQAHFDACDWYTGTIDPNDFKESNLSDIEIANRDTIVAYETEMGYR